MEYAKGIQIRREPSKSKALLFPINPYSFPRGKKPHSDTGYHRHWGPFLLSWQCADATVQESRSGEEQEPQRQGKEGAKGMQPNGLRSATTPNNPVSLLRRFQRAFTARLATHSNVESPSSRLRIPNSTRREPAPAVHVSLLLSRGTPVFRFTWGQEETKDLCQHSGSPQG